MPTFDIDGATVKVRVSSRETAGSYTVCEVQTVGPIEVPSHLHSYEDQWVHVLDGHFLFQIGAESVSGQPGTCVAIPRDAVYRISSDEPGRLLIFARPGGLDLFLGDAQAHGLLPSVLEKHGIVLGEGIG